MDCDIATIAALIGDGARARILLALMGGVALPAGELASSANVTAQTASSHLSKLLKGKLVRSEAQGRHRYYRLASADVGAAIEALATLAHMPIPPHSTAFRKGESLRFARTCYNHLAGRVAVEITEQLTQRRLLLEESGRQYRVTPEGRLWFAELGIDPGKSTVGRGGLVRQCLDWSERRHHMAGPLATALLRRLVELKWIRHRDHTRAVHLTGKGRQQLRNLLGLSYPS